MKKETKKEERLRAISEVINPYAKECPNRHLWSEGYRSGYRTGNDAAKELVMDLLKENERLEQNRNITLTDDWLLKLGFKAIDERGYSKQVINKEGNYEYNFVLYKVSGGYDNDVCLYVIKYVRQLQNLYLALTGEKLTIHN